VSADDTPLNHFIKTGYTEELGITREQAWEQGICAGCRKKPTWHTEAGRREYAISAICEPCFDKMFPEEE